MLVNAVPTCYGTLPDCEEAHHIRCKMRAGIWENKVSLMFTIEGLIEPDTVVWS